MLRSNLSVSNFSVNNSIVRNGSRKKAKKKEAAALMSTLAELEAVLLSDELPIRMGAVLLSANRQVPVLLLDNSS
eukprot:SAG22_NODE_593_length_8808_cov_21.674590_6_plen_75_part_00